MTFVDIFVQSVIERARQESLGSWANGGVETRVQEENEEYRSHAVVTLNVSKTNTI